MLLWDSNASSTHICGTFAAFDSSGGHNVFRAHLSLLAAFGLGFDCADGIASKAQIPQSIRL
jgi:hypothetical protein